jgi:hypothetical protein
MRKAPITPFQLDVLRLVAALVVAAIASAGCSTPPASKPNPGEPGISLDHPTGGSRVDFPVDGFDLCAPFSYALFQKRTFTARTPAERGPGSCRWRGEGFTATITDETGATLAEVSHDPRYRPGYAGLEGNRYWVTATPTSPPYTAHLFLAAGPAQPRRLLHVHVETEAERVAAPQPDRAYTARGLAEIVAAGIDSQMTEALRATKTSPPR